MNNNSFSEKELVKKGKHLAFLLRHDADAFNQGLIDKNGWRSVKELESLGYSKKLLEEITLTNNKQRYEFSNDEKKIRARQGHSIPVDVGLVEQTPPDVLYHGTTDEVFYEHIVKEGLVPSEISFNSDTMFENKEDEILALGSFVYNGISSVQEYIYKKLAISPDSVRMFNITNYEYPLVAICIKGDLLKKEHCSDISNRIENCMNEVRCYRPPRDYSYTDIDFTWDDVEFYFEAPEDAYFIIYHYRPESFEDREAERKNIDMAVSEGLKMTRIDDNIDINMPTDAHTTAGVALLKLIAEYLDEKFVLPDWKPYTLELIKHRSQELFFKITKHYGESRNFLYRKY